MTASIIIPTLNEAQNIERLLDRLSAGADERLLQIIVADAGSEDGTLTVAQKKGATPLCCPKPGRACQMNHAVKHSQGEVLYFVHADTLPPISYLDDIEQAVNEGFPIGSYQSRYDTDRLLLKLNAFFTRFDFAWCRGGDQSIFITRQVFEEFEGYPESFKIMEEYELIKQIRRKYPFKIMPKATLISARKYDDNSYLRVQLANLIVFNMYRLGCSQERMVHTYSKMLNYR
ncbi:MAG TPA: TIGR04283 family arsenosugar biosynthesis glycosyltransferase [Phaeodactylibacter sp.]|nr:TIGR04283 family arsenosugar biosynthesis glycosyltransferase [Phaeodactylibacter sp.]